MGVTMKFSHLRLLAVALALAGCAGENRMAEHSLALAEQEAQAGAWVMRCPDGPAAPESCGLGLTARRTDGSWLEVYLGYDKSNRLTMAFVTPREAEGTMLSLTSDTRVLDALPLGRSMEQGCVVLWTLKREQKDTLFHSRQFNVRYHGAFGKPADFSLSVAELKEALDRLNRLKKRQS